MGLWPLQMDFDAEEKWKKPVKEGHPDLVIFAKVLKPTLINGRPRLGEPRDDQPLTEATPSKCRFTSSDPGSPLF